MLKSDEIMLMKKLGIPDKVINYEAPAIPERVRIDPAMVETDTRIYDIIHDIEVKIDRGCKDLIVRTIQNIGGATYEEITLDEDKVFEMLQKSVTRKPIVFTIDQDTIDWKCPNCGIRFSTYHLNKHCSDCGQKLDWGNWEERRK